MVTTTGTESENETDKKLCIILDEAISNGGLLLSREVFGDELGSALFLLGSLPSVLSRSDTPHMDGVLKVSQNFRPDPPTQKSR